MSRRLMVPALLLVWAATSYAGDPDVLTLRGKDAPANAIWLDSLDLRGVDQDVGTAQAGRSVSGSPMRINGASYQHGVGTHTQSTIRVNLKGVAQRFVSMGGVDDDTKGKGSLGFEIWVDGHKVLDSRRWIKGGEDPQLFSVDLHGAKELSLIAIDGFNGNDNDHADWAGAMLLLEPGAKEKPQIEVITPTPVPILTHHTSLLPAIHGPRVTGATPGRPFLFLIPATGEKPLTYSAKDLPAGLTLDAKSGIISGSLKQDGTTVVELGVKNARGVAYRALTIVGGKHKLAQTPPLGWNAYNCWCDVTSDQKIREAADAMISSGLAAHGYQYINVDDGWSDGRDANGELKSNKKTFPDMKALADYVHSKGLKFGIYSSPGPKTCGGLAGSYQHEAQDAKTFARWGVDYLKYDWCSYSQIVPNPDLAARIKPHRIMRDALDDCDRDIVYSLCQYGDGNVWEWGEQVGANCWRTAFDMSDTWESMAPIGFGQSGHEKFAGPGHWNDPDMLVVGQVGWGLPRPTKLRPNEQVTHMTLWVLQSSPLILGCDLTHMDEFTLGLVSNDEVLDVNQDPLGKPAGRISQTGRTEVWARTLFDGTRAVGLFNRGPQPEMVKVTWKELNLSGPQPVRDLWQQKDLGERTDGFEVSVPPHGAVLVKIGKPQP